MFLPRQRYAASVVDVGFFCVTERDKAFWYRLAKHLSEAAGLIRMEFSKRAWYTQLNKMS